MTASRQPISFLATAQPALARAFYADVIGLTPMEHSPHALVFRDGTATLRVQIVTDLHPAPYTAHGWQVPDIALEISRLAAKGVVFSVFEHLGQGATGVWTTPDGHKIAWFKDPCGNVLSLTEFADP